jgi:hypothetical protein
MLPAMLLMLGTTPFADPTGPKVYPPAYVPAEAPYGYLYQPAYDVRAVPRPPVSPYVPKPGDILLMSDTNWFWTLLFRLARTGKPGHNGIVITMPDGRLGFYEAGFGDTLYSRVTPLDYRINMYPGFIWVRPRRVPLTPEEDRHLTEFAMDNDGQRYALLRFLLHGTTLSPRGPIRTAIFGRPVGMGNHYYCSQATVEALIHIGLIPERTARPAATFPQDLFYDRSRNRFINRHPPLADGWDPPQLWTPLPGTALKGKSRPQPPSPWPGDGGAYLVQPLPTPGKQVPTPTVVGYVPGEFYPIAPVEKRPQRVGLFDRPGRRGR